jgi:hypothetical protein
MPISRAGVPGDYWTGISDGSGMVVFTGLTASLCGPYDLVVTAPNSIPYEGTIQSQAGSAGFISLDDTVYSCSATVGITVGDADLAGAATQDVTVETTGGDLETVALAESGPDNGIFQGSIDTSSASPVPGDGVLQTASGETITATYIDQDDGNGNQVTVQAAAGVDCGPPEFNGLVSAAPAGDAIVLAWNAATEPNGPVTYNIYRDETAGPPIGSLLASTCALTYRDGSVSFNQAYYYVVRAADRIGNEDGNMTERGAKIGPVVLPFYDGFESGILQAGWSIFTTNQGRVRVSTLYPYAGGYSVLLDDSENGGDNSRAAVILTADLSGQSNISLSFYWREFSDENDPEDGVFISDNYGANWFQILSFNNGPSSYTGEMMDRC